MLKNRKAITLIALVITIVVLIILAGVAISLTLGDNGVFNKAKYAKQVYLNTKEEEEVQLSKAENYIDNLRDVVDNQTKYPDYGNVKTLSFTDKKYTVTEDGYIQVKFQYTSVANISSDILYINKTIVAQSVIANTYANVYTPLFLVKKGDIIEYSATAQQVNLYFMPFR